MLLAEVRVHSLWWPRLDFHGDTRWSNCSRFVGVWPDCSHIPNTTWDRELKIRKDNWTAKPRSLTCLYYVHLLSKFNNRFSSIEILSLSRRFQIQLLWKGKKRLGVVVAQLSERSLPPRRYAVQIQLSAKFVLNISLLPTVLKRRTRGREWPIKNHFKGTWRRPTSSWRRTASSRSATLASRRCWRRGGRGRTRSSAPRTTSARRCAKGRSTTRSPTSGL